MFPRPTSLFTEVERTLFASSVSSSLESYHGTDLFPITEITATGPQSDIEKVDAHEKSKEERATANMLPKKALENILFIFLDILFYFV